MPTYSEAWSLPGGGKNCWIFVAPFLKFKTEVMRTSYGTVRQAIDEVKSSNPKIRKNGLLRISSFTLTAALLPAILGTVTKALFDYDDDDEDTLRRSLPEWQKNALMVFLPKDEQGDAQFMDLSYMNPFGIYHSPDDGFSRALSGDPDEAIWPAVSAGMMEFFKPLYSPQLWMGAFTDVLYNKDTSSGEKIWGGAKTELQNATAITERLIRPFVPGTIESMNRVYKGINQQVRSSGKAYDPWDETLNMIWG